jgi:hypothetical protein
MPQATSAKPPPALTSKPRVPGSGRPASGSSTVAKRRWNAPPAALYPRARTTRTSAKPSNDAHLPDVSTARVPLDPRAQFRAAIAAVPVSALPHKTSDSRKNSQSGRKPEDAAAATTAMKDPQGVVASPPPSGRRLSQQTRPHRASDTHNQPPTKVDVVETPGKVSRPPSASASLRADPKRQQLLAREAELNAMQGERRRESLHSAQVLKSLRRQDVEADDVRPLIEIIYWSPFVEVRRDAAAAIASLSRNSTLPLYLYGSQAAGH